MDVAVKKERYHLLDSFRGLLLIMMIIYHTMFNIMVLGEGSFSVYNTPCYIFQQTIGWGFIFLSGMCRAIGKRHLRRGLMVLGAAAIVTFVTSVFMPSQAINFGILVMLGSSMLILIPMENFLKKIYPPFGFICAVMLFILLRNIAKGNLGFEGLIFMDLPDFLYRNYFTAYLGFPPAHFSSGDYYPLFPWFFLYLSGYFFWRYLENKEWIAKPLSVKVPLLSFLGRHSLMVYLLHQPLCYAVVYLFCEVL